MENKEVKNKNRNSIKPIIIIGSIVLAIIRFGLYIREDRTEEQTKEMIRLIQNIPQIQNNYLTLKFKTINYSYRDIPIDYKDNKVIAVLAEIRLDSSIASLAITIDSTASLLLPGQKNSIQRTTEEEVLSISNSIFSRAEKLLPKMELMRHTTMKNPKVNEIMVYVRTNDLKTFVHRIYINGFYNTYLEKNIQNDLSLLWEMKTKK
jgi:hypothetical protein